MSSGRISGSSPLARGLPRLRGPQALRRRIIPARAGFTTTPPGTLAGTRDHPRSRGVYDRDTCPAPASSGSSPLARGLLLHDLRGLSNVGIIPARAGFTASSGPRSRRAGDHPRSRGVYRGGYGREARGDGSSPLARGLREAGEDQYGEPGIIPARAGFTILVPAPGRGHTDHPRSRGVYRPVRFLRHSCSGSSPLARGLHRHRLGGDVIERIIPARAGFTSPALTSATPTRDHPRSRGVYASDKNDISDFPGSSPLARGLRNTYGHPRLAGGIIPARAGFTHQLITREARCEGSSPLARGLRVRASTRDGVGRIIPARAGFTPQPPASAGNRGDHPRSRGVYDRALPYGVGVYGSSPLARGLRHDRRRDHLGHVDHPRSRGVY